MEAGNESGESVVLEVGSEGGSLTLLESAESPPRYAARLNDQSMMLVGEGDAITRQDPWGSWAEAVTALGKYPWRRLHPMAVSPAHADRVWALIQAGSERLSPRALDAWARLCGVHRPG